MQLSTTPLPCILLPASLHYTSPMHLPCPRYGRVVSVSHPTEPVTLSAVCKELAARGEGRSTTTFTTTHHRHHFYHLHHHHRHQVKPGTPNPAHLVTEEALGLVRALLALDYRCTPLHLPAPLCTSLPVLHLPSDPVSHPHFRERSTAGQALKSSYLKGVKINT